MTTVLRAVEANVVFALLMLWAVVYSHLTNQRQAEPPAELVAAISGWPPPTVVTGTLARGARTRIYWDRDQVRVERIAEWPPPAPFIPPARMVEAAEFLALSVESAINAHDPSASGDVVEALTYFKDVWDDAALDRLLTAVLADPWDAPDPWTRVA